MSKLLNFQLIVALGSNTNVGGVVLVAPVLNSLSVFVPLWRCFDDLQSRLKNDVTLDARTQWLLNGTRGVLKFSGSLELLIASSTKWFLEQTAGT